MSGSVKVDRQSVIESWRRRGYGDFWVELRTSEATETSFSRAVAAVNESFEVGGGPYAQLNTRSPRGFVVMSAMSVTRLV